MAIRASVLERVQVGIETTSGTGVSAGKRLMGIDRLTFNPVEPQGRHRSAGTEMETGVSLQKVYSEFEFEGPLCFLTVPYFLSSMLGDDSASPFTYTPLPYAADTIKTLTIETGSSVRAEKAAYCVTSNLRFRFTREDITVNGGGFGRKLSLNQTLTASPTSVGKALADPQKVSVLIGTSVAGLAEVEHLEAEIDLPARWAPHITLNAATDSFDEHKKIASNPTVTLTLESVADAETLWAAARAKTKYYVRILVTSSEEFGLGTTYEFKFTGYGTIESPSRADNDDVMAATFVIHLEPVSDFGTGCPYEIVVTNGASAL